MINSLEVGRQCVADFGEPVTVTPVVGDPVEVQMIFDEPDDDVRLGNLAGNLNAPVFRCMPADAAVIEEGALLTRGGTDYEVFDVLPRHQDLTEIRAQER